MTISRTKLWSLQALVAVIALTFWHLGGTVRMDGLFSVLGWTVPKDGAYLLPKFFFSTPLDVAERVMSRRHVVLSARSRVQLAASYTARWTVSE